MFKKLALFVCLTQLGLAAAANASGRVCFYEDMNFGKASFCLSGGQQINNLHDYGFWNDRISSVYVEGNLSVNMCTDSLFRGACTTIYQTVPNMWSLGANWNDTVSSISVTDNDYYPPNPPPPPGPYPPPGQRLPYGSYLQTCNSCQNNYPILQCSCRDMSGYMHWTSLDTRYCRSDIANINGQLRCN